MGALWVFVHFAFGNFRCEDCGKIERQELSEDDLGYVNRVGLWFVGICSLILLVPVVFVVIRIVTDS